MFVCSYVTSSNFTHPTGTKLCVPPKTEIQSPKIDSPTQSNNFEQRKLRDRVLAKIKPPSTDDDIETKSESEEETFQAFLAKGDVEYFFVSGHVQFMYCFLFIFHRR